RGESNSNRLSTHCERRSRAWSPDVDALSHPLRIFIPAEPLLAAPEGLERIPIHYVPHGLCQYHGAADQSGSRSVADRAFAEFSDRTAHSRGRATVSQEESRHSYDGRFAYRGLYRRPDIAVDKSQEPLRLACAAVDPGVRSDRLCRRLH